VIIKVVFLKNHKLIFINQFKENIFCKKDRFFIIFLLYSLFICVNKYKTELSYYYKIKISHCRIKRNDKKIVLRYYRSPREIISYYSFFFLSAFIFSLGLIIWREIHWLLGLPLILLLALPMTYYSLALLYQLYYLTISIHIKEKYLKVYKLALGSKKIPLSSVNQITFRVDISQNPWRKITHTDYAVHLFLEAKKEVLHLLTLHPKEKIGVLKNLLLSETHEDASKLARFLLSTIDEIAKK